MYHRILQTVPVADLVEKRSRSYLLSFTDRCGEKLICALCLEEAWAMSMDASVDWDSRKMVQWRSKIGELDTSK